MKEDKDMEQVAEPKALDAEAPEKEKRPRHAGAMWIALALAALAWCALFVNGYVALGLGVAALVAGIWASVVTRHGLRKASIAALVASAVLVIILSAFFLAIGMMMKGS